MVWLIVLAVGPWFTMPAQSQHRPYFLHNQNPFLQVFGLPAPEGGTLTGPGKLDSRLIVSVANHADENDDGSEAVVLDGESYVVDTLFRYGLGGRWEIGIDIPYVAHRGGELDDVIEGWHEIFGLDNSERQRPSNHLQLSYQRDGVVHADLRDGGGGIGDVRLTGALQLAGSAAADRALALRALVKLPTGKGAQLRGSGAADVALGLEGTDAATFARRNLTLHGQIGALRLGNGDLLTDAQKRLVPFASAGLTWRWTAAVDLHAQLALQGAYYDSGLDEIGGNTASFAFGGTLRWRRAGIEVDLGLVEDLVSDATPDFGLYLAVRQTAFPAAE